MVKNAGIAYSKMIQGAYPEDVKDALKGKGYPFLESVRQKLHDQNKFGDWSEHASYRTLNLWRRFVDMKGSERDPSYEGVKRIVEYLEKTDQGKITPSEAAAKAANAPPVKKKKKKKKKKKGK